MLDQARELVRAELAESQPRRFSHLQGACRRAEAAAPLFSAEDGRLLVVTALVHDVGYCDSARETGFHPLDGARFLAERGYPARLCDLVAHHSCARLEADLRGLGSELSQWTDERSELRDALWWADMTTSPDGEVVTFKERVAEIQARYGPEDLVSRFIRAAGPELRGAVERTETRLAGLR
ncbi:HD domain-containing protein [Actinokineospora pegani]|uniref:HD domain-containing protein n=1 Tax=Actinokineospora pegani TaxID=2654637 RepID=UPI001F420183|nr:HD domain-containing protein [Actinokineospora pegani]